MGWTVSVFWFCSLILWITCCVLVPFGMNFKRIKTASEGTQEPKIRARGRKNPNSQRRDARTQEWIKQSARRRKNSVKQTARGRENPGEDALKEPKATKDATGDGHRGFAWYGGTGWLWVVLFFFFLFSFARPPSCAVGRKDPDLRCPRRARKATDSLPEEGHRQVSSFSLLLLYTVALWALITVALWA